MLPSDDVEKLAEIIYRHSQKTCTAKAEEYKDGEGWRLLAVLKKMLSDNNINIKKKMAAWRKDK